MKSPFLNNGILHVLVKLFNLSRKKSLYSQRIKYKCTKIVHVEMSQFVYFFQATCLYLNLETEEIKHARDNVSQATLTRRESKTQEAVSLMKSVIRTADRG